MICSYCENHLEESRLTLEGYFDEVDYFCDYECLLLYSEDVVIQSETVLNEIENRVNKAKKSGFTVIEGGKE